LPPFFISKQPSAHVFLHIFPIKLYVSHLHNSESSQSSPSWPVDRRLFQQPSSLIVELDIPSDDLSDERTRTIERGSKIVSIMPSVHAVVLQAPRGNLETVNPRALVLANVRQNIERKEFRAAFLTCRTHRIDMNILHTHDPDLFITNIPSFIQQLKDVDYIDLFLSSLK
jgi:hypothetical protein